MATQLELSLCDVPEPTGVQLRDEAIESLKKRHKAIVRKCQRYVVEIVLSGSAATADDLKHVDSGKRHRGFVGAVFRELRRQGIIFADGYLQSGIAKNHARPVGVWKCVDVDRARQWLNDNPEIVG